MSDPAKPLISVALCTYNGARYLREQLDSLLTQTHRNMEIVAVDDGSEDQTPALLQEYARRDSRLRVVVNPVNLGFRRNFDYAMSLCVGEYIAPCDQDDIWLADKLRTLVQAIGAHAMIYCDSELIAADGRSLGACMSDRWVMQSIGDPAAFVLINCVSGHAMLFRRDLLDGAPSVPDVFFHDWWLSALAASRSGVAYCPQKLVRYRQHDENVTDILRAREERKKRPAGYGWKHFEDAGKRIACLAALHDSHHAFFVTWHRLWKQHATAWISWRLAAFMVAHRRRIFALWKRSEISLLYKAATYVFGLQLRRRFRRAKYTLEDP